MLDEINIKYAVYETDINREEVPERMEHKGETYYFCSVDCHNRFAAERDKHVSHA